MTAAAQPETNHTHTIRTLVQRTVIWNLQRRTYTVQKKIKTLGKPCELILNCMCVVERHVAGLHGMRMKTYVRDDRTLGVLQTTQRVAF